MGTLVEEIIGNRLGREVRAGDTVVAPVDCALAHDVTAPLAIEAFERMEMPLHDPQRVVLVFDHVMPAATVAAAELHQRIRRFAADHAVRNLFAEGICHIIMVEKGFARPGGIVVGADSHSTTYGALGCFSTGMGSTDVGVILATGQTWFRVPETLRVNVTGELVAPLTAKDVALNVLRRIGGDGADYMAVEWGGETVERMTLDQRLTLANLSADMGGKAGLCEVDDTTLRHATPAGGDAAPASSLAALRGRPRHRRQHSAAAGGGSAGRRQRPRHRRRRRHAHRRGVHRQLHQRTPRGHRGDRPVPQRPPGARRHAHRGGARVAAHLSRGAATRLDRDHRAGGRAGDEPGLRPLPGSAARRRRARGARGVDEQSQLPGPDGQPGRGDLPDQPRGCGRHRGRGLHHRSGEAR